MDLRQKMIGHIRAHYGLDDPLVFAAMLAVPREEFVPRASQHLAYEDMPVSIGHGQTLSQPYTVAFMTHLLISPSLSSGQKVLEIGTGSGYQTAVLARIFTKVYTIEIVPELAGEAKERLVRLGFKNIHFKMGNGEDGWATCAPYDRIIVTAGIGDGMPKQLLNQLGEGGVAVAPLGKDEDKQMTRFTKTAGKIATEQFGTFRFVPFVRDTIT